MAMATSNQNSPALTVSMNVPHSQNTAPVLEFRCMYTSDLRRKQKRWQDGRLKFHTFNKRVMVYDERSNAIGDTHWRKDYDFDDGEELELERGGILVEVGECIGKRDQDLTELVDKRVKDREERIAAKNTALAILPQAALSQPQTPAGQALLRPKSLNAVLGNPTGHYGKAAVPSLSPFEQRQQVDRDKSENERPAKRRKQDDAPASKSGYAQSLMGTKLNLASSRPPSTATIIYEPVRLSIQRTPAVSIDLTVDEDDHSTPGKARPDTIRGERDVKHQRQRPCNKSPARGAYASRLTVISLSLNKPESFASKRSAKGLGLTTKGIHQVERTRSSSSVGPDSLMEDESSEERPAKRILQQKKPAKQKENLKRPDLAIPSRDSSLPVMNWSTAVSKSTSPLKGRITPDYLGARVMGDQPVSTLRIKSRASRKMMMFMERPISRYPAPTEPGDTLEVPKQHNSKPAQDPVLSQATLRLDAFREQQEQRLQERLSGKRPDTDLDESSSSSAESGIDHRTIDVLLFHRAKPPAKVPAAASVETSQPSAGLNPERAIEDEQVSQFGKQRSQGNKAIAPVSPRPDVEHVNPDLSPPNSQESPQPQLPVISKKMPKPRIRSTGATSGVIALPSDAQKPRQAQPTSGRKVLEQSTIPSTDAVSTMAPPLSDPVREIPLEPAAGEVISNESSRKNTSRPISPLAPIREAEEALEASSLKNIGSRQAVKFCQSAVASCKPESPDISCEKTSLQSRANSNTPAVGQPSLPLNSHTAIREDKEIAPVMPKSIARFSPTTRSKIPSLPAEFSSAIMSATDHFRSIIKYSASSSNQIVLQPPPDLEQPDAPPGRVPEAQKGDPISGEVGIKASPRSSPPVTAAWIIEAQRDEAAKTGGRMDNAADLTISTVPDAGTGQLKAKLVNPATRGLSVQMTANKTVNALASNTLPNMPLPPRTVIWPARDPAHDQSLANRAKESLTGVTQGGPWSRESFDLFGSWRPPGRATGSSTVNG